MKINWQNQRLQLIRVLGLFFVFMFLVYENLLFGFETGSKPTPNLAGIVGPDTLWTRTFGGADNDWGYSVDQIFDGGYIIAGGTGGTAVDSGDVYLIRTNDKGDALWTRNYGGDRAYSVRQTTDCGFIVTGVTSKDRGDSTDIYIIKVDAGLSGSIDWTQNYGGDTRDAGYAVQQTIDGGYIITGINGGDVYLIKINSGGDTTWTKKYGGIWNDCGYSVEQTSDGGYIIAGAKKTNDGQVDSADVYLIKTDSLGNSIWTKTYGGPKNDWGRAVQQTSDGGYIIAGYTSSFGFGLSDVYLIKTNSSGDSVWTRTFGGVRDDWGYSVQETSDGGYIICGTTANTDSLADPANIYLIKTTTMGYESWAASFKGAHDDRGYSVQITADGGYIIAGCTNSFGAGKNDVYLIKTKPLINLVLPSGGLAWQGGTRHEIVWTHENQPSSAYHYRILFSSTGSSTYSDTIAHNLSSTTQSFNWDVPVINSNQCYIKIELFDSAAGRVVTQDTNDYYFIIDIAPPIIDSTTIWNNTSDPGPYQILTKATDNLSGVDSVILYYRRNEDPAWILQLMAQIDSTPWFRNSIPAVTLPYDTVRYFIKALDFTFPANSVTDPSGAPNDYYWFIAENFGLGENNRKPESFSFVLKSNPTKARAIFHLVLSADDFVDLRIYDITGKLVDNPIKKEMPQGKHEIIWDPDVSAGVYFYLLRSSMHNRGGKFLVVH